MFERFTDKARKIVILAKAKATERGDDQIRPVHMLYGLAATDGVAARVLTALGVDAAAVDRELGRARAGPGTSPGALGPADEAASRATPRRWPRSASTWTRSSAGSRTASVPARSSACRPSPGARSTGPDGCRWPSRPS